MLIPQELQLSQFYYMIAERQLISHLYQNKENGQWVIQSNDEHQKGVAKIAASFAKRFELPSWGYALGLLHDKGKERAAFQQYIRKVNGLSTDDKKHYNDHAHAFVGGILAKDFMGKDVLNLLANQIISHHTGLYDYVEAENILQEKPLPEEIDKDNINIDIPFLYKEFLESPFSKFKVDRKHFHHLSRMLFSCLVDADRLDTEQFMNLESWQKRKCSSTVVDLLPKLEAHLQKLQLDAVDTEVNRIRRKVQEQCSKTSLGEKGFYSLTVPTGGGKTLSSLLWAMKHAANHAMNRIIIAIPYTSIIVQTAGLLKKIFGEENVLEHHSNFNPDDIKNEEVREKAKLATENWDYPIIVTTNVQLFESMFSNRPSECRKLHNIVNSVIILDEVQTLPTDFLQPIVDAMKAYQKMFGVSILFTTASQPVLSGLIEGANPKVGFKGIEHIMEIIPTEFALHDKLRRVKLEIDNTGKTYDEIAAKVSEHDKVLCIVNTRKDAKELYNRLPDEGVKIHLSRMMCPAHISETICKIKALLKDEAHPIVRVIATQLVEAGVDIDFPVVFRQEAGLDSVLQAAGRCNREGKRELSESMVYIFDLEESYSVPNQRQQIDVSKGILQDYTDIADLKAIHDYFTRLYHYRGTSLDKKKIMDEFQKMECNFAEVAKEFKLIEENTKTIFINREPEADELLQELRIKGVTRERMRKAGQYCIQIYDNAKSENSFFDRLNGAGMLRPVSEEMQDFYELVDGEQYSEEYGLDFSLEDGMAFFV